MTVITSASLCRYVNPTDCIQAIRVVDNPESQLEKILSPGEHILFEAPLEASLEISSLTAGTVQSECISCQLLKVQSSGRFSR